jgi:nitrogen-specific signal transduction histidine kinase
MQRDDKQEQALRLLQLRFIGKILAGFTHESKNYLAIINESAGLIGDMIQMGKSSEKDLSEYLQIIRSVEDQIRRSNDHFRALNRFAHRMDTELSSFNINESLEELVALLTRFANQKKITLKKNFQEDIPAIYGNPALFQFLVFSFLDKGFSMLDKDSMITLQTVVADHTVQIKIIPEGTVVKQESDVPFLPFEMAEKIINQLQGNIKQEGGGETLLILPLTAS